MMTDTPRPMSPVLQFVLTRHVPCAALALAMLSALVWLPMLFAGLPLLAVLFSFAAVLLHLLTPALFALIFMGGGLRYTLQVSGIITLAVIVLSGMDVLLGVVVGLFYCVLPALSARSLMRMGGVSRSATQLAVGMFVAIITALLLAAQSQDLALHDFVNQMLQPMFEVAGNAGSQMPAEALDQVRNILSWTLPGLIAFSLWLTWWMDVLLARKLAMRFGFYEGDRASLLQLRFGKLVGFGLMLSLILANVGFGSLQYIAISLALMLAVAVSVQGISVAHVWLKSKDLQMAIAMMYVMLFLWSMVVIPFIILGLLDIWFDYRRNVNPTDGGK